jgi:hypothetical protein
VHIAVPSLARLVSPRPKINRNLGTMASSARLLSKPYRKDELARILREVLDVRTCPKPSAPTTASSQVPTPGHRFGHSFRRTECERTLANVTKIAEYSRIVRCAASFGTRGSQVQILPLRPALSQT